MPAPQSTPAASLPVAPKPAAPSMPAAPGPQSFSQQPASSRGTVSSHSSGYRAPSGPDPQVMQIINQEIAQEIEWRGSFLRKVREAKRVSIEEMAATTKITKTYLLAVEDENFSKLPAAVYLRGFVIQVAKMLKLPEEKVAADYMARYYQARP
jgi:DNA-binding transcriptional regulator YiaG